MCNKYNFFFFFQAEDGIRDGTVTGVQTCALPIYFSSTCPPACVGAANDDAELKFERALEGSKEFREVQIQSVTSSGAAGNQTGDQKVVQLTTIYSRG